MAARGTAKTDDVLGASAATGSIAVALAGAASLVSGVVVALAVFYLAEASASGQVCGSISDIGSAGWDLVAAPLCWGLGSVVSPRRSVGSVLSAAAGPSAQP